jgi:hypothetical protein
VAEWLLFKLDLPFTGNWRLTLDGNYRTSFCHIHRHKAASRDRQKLAVSCPSNCIKTNGSYPGTFVSAPDPG